MAKMRAVQVSKAGGPLEMVEREIPTPGAGFVRVRIEASGICHSDVLTKEGLWPGLALPRVPGHEIAGVVDAVGPGTSAWNAGDRVGIGWHGGHCGICDSCRRGDFLLCRMGTPVPGIAYDGGYADYVVAPAVALARIPDGLTAVEAAPLMCAGVTTFNPLRNSGARAGDLVAVLGIGGLGHLGVQFAAQMGFDTVAIARGSDKETLARELGARHYIDSQKQDPAAELTKLGGARVILATVTSAPAMTAVLGGLGPEGKFIIVGAPPEPLQVPAGLLIFGRRSIAGWPSGRSIDSQDTMAFAAQTGIRSRNETYPLDRAAAAYDRMMSGQARFRVVLTMS
ncbi:MAG TPA: alcohol dehydrogenase [Thermoanaerobaculia bacterium]|nr:alcohol dehydrogenase [Thermoanaerobaculia bacterium]